MKFRNTFNWAFFLAILSLSSCGGGSSSVTVNRGKTMVIHLKADPQGLNPFTTTDAATSYIQNMIFDNLIFLDYATLELRPVLAESLPIESPDHLSFTFKLRKDAKFSDGKPVTSKDVVFSFKAAMNPKVESGQIRGELRNYSDCIAIDDYTIEFKLTKPSPFTLNRLALQFYILPKHIYDPQNLTDKYTGKEATDADKNPNAISEDLNARLLSFANQFNDEKFAREQGFVIGSGRYIFDKWITGQSVHLIKNRNYWNASSNHPFDKQNMDTLLYKIIPDAESALISLKNGTIDFSDAFEPAQFQERMSDADFETNFTKKFLPYPSFEYIGWNQNIKGHPEKAFFADVKVRTAMSYLVDVDAIIENLAYGSVTPLTSMVYKERPEFNNNIPRIKPNEEKAKALLFDAGWVDSDNDGFLDKNIQGMNVMFEFTLCYRKDNNLRKNIALNLQERFRKAKIKMNIQEMDNNLLASKLKDCEIDAWIGGWAYDSDEQDYYTIFHSSQIGGGSQNYGSYSNFEADRLMDAIRGEFDAQKRYELHKQVQQIMFDDQPYTLLFNNGFRVAYNNRLNNNNWYKQRPCYDPAEFMIAGGKNAN